MMQRILHNMYVEPELLAELNEEQKQILFYKIRQEQVRRWKEREAREESSEKNSAPSPREGERKHIQWLQGMDGEVWVWVMGEAPGDRSYEQIITELMEEKARRQAQLEAQELWQKKEAEIKQKFRDAIAKEKARLVAGKWKEEAEDRKAAKLEEERIQEELKKREEEERQKGEEEVRCAEEKRVKELYMTLQLEQKQSEKDDKEWEEQLQRSKAADEEMMRRARWARDEYKRQSIRAMEKGHFKQQMPVSRRHSAIGIEPSDKSQDKVPSSGKERPRPGLQPADPPLYRRRQSRKHSSAAAQPLMDSPAWVRAPRPSSRESVILWFSEDQKPKRAGYERMSSTIATWFHGIITREESEKLLMNEAEGSFLVRVSERIWGYILSYRTATGFKHFLIDASGDYYSFLGVDQNRHATLADLIEFHKEEVITTTGKEQLKEACRHTTPPGDYGGLFP
ncbi:SH2 domain-containing protein 4B [Pangasianodon hypophthalmus]|uniref:SH2 domain-containing protein 4B n=1 Tax=Pangasianodon hypophthalmus TaxID=310915 RepID=UPI0023081758|nr:SH2 domain-containing protein 4B [Pangasianodon hypophthalmus]